MKKPLKWAALGVVGAAAAVLLLAGVRQAGHTDSAAASEPRVIASTARESSPALRPYLGKPRPPLRVRVVEGQELYVGVPVAVQIEVTSEVEIRDLSLRLVGEGGLDVGQASHYRVPDLAQDRPQVVELTVTPLSGGPQRLAGSLEFELGGQRMSMPVSLSLQVGGPVTVFPAQSKPEREPQRDATGELVYPLAADHN